MTIGRAALLVCGILSSLLYVGGDVYRGMRYEGYSFSSQTISELSAIGAPSPGLSVVLAVAYDALLVAFGFGVLRSAEHRRALRIVGILFVVFGVAGLAWIFAPMQQRGAEMALTDIMHIALSVMSMVFLFAVLTFVGGLRLAANLPTPWLGVYERIMLYAFMLWVAVLAIALLRESERLPARGRGPEVS